MIQEGWDDAPAGCTNKTLYEGTVLECDQDAHDGDLHSVTIYWQEEHADDEE